MDEMYELQYTGSVYTGDKKNGRLEGNGTYEFESGNKVSIIFYLSIFQLIRYKDDIMKHNLCLLKNSYCTIISSIFEIIAFIVKSKENYNNKI